MPIKVSIYLWVYQLEQNNETNGAYLPVGDLVEKILIMFTFTQDE